MILDSLIEQILNWRDSLVAVKLGKYASATSTPPSIPEIPAAIAVSLGNGLVRYTFTNAVTGSAQNTLMTIIKSHRFVRAEFQQVVSATGAADTTGINIKIQRLNIIQAAGSSGRASTTLLATNGSVATDSVILVGGIGWEATNGTYNIAWTGQNNDTLTFDIYIQFL